MLPQPAGNLSIANFEDGAAATEAARSLNIDFASKGGFRPARDCLVDRKHPFRKLCPGEKGTPCETIRAILEPLGLKPTTLGRVLLDLGIARIKKSEAAKSDDASKHAAYDVTDAPWGGVAGEGVGAAGSGDDGEGAADSIPSP